MTPASHALRARESVATLSANSAMCTGTSPAPYTPACASRGCAQPPGSPAVASADPAPRHAVRLPWTTPSTRAWCPTPPAQVCQAAAHSLSPLHVCQASYSRGIHAHLGDAWIVEGLDDVCTGQLACQHLWQRVRQHRPLLGPPGALGAVLLEHLLPGAAELAQVTLGVRPARHGMTAAQVRVHQGGAASVRVCARASARDAVRTKYSKAHLPPSSSGHPKPRLGTVRLLTKVFLSNSGTSWKPTLESHVGSGPCSAARARTYCSVTMSRLRRTPSRPTTLPSRSLN